MTHRLTLLIVLAACSVDQPTPRAPAPTPPVVVDPVVEAAPDPPAPPALNKNQVSVQELTQRLQQFAVIMNEMKDKAREAAATAGTECEKSLASITAAVEVSQRTTAELGRQPPEWNIAPRARYLSLCGQLAAEVQQCSRFDYRVDNDDACRPIMEGLSDAHKAIIDQMSRRVAR